MCPALSCLPAFAEATSFLSSFSLTSGNCTLEISVLFSKKPSQVSLIGFFPSSLCFHNILFVILFCLIQIFYVRKYIVSSKIQGSCLVYPLRQRLSALHIVSFLYSQPSINISWIDLQVGLRLFPNHGTRITELQKKDLNMTMLRIW